MCPTSTVNERNEGSNSLSWVRERAKWFVQPPPHVVRWEHVWFFYARVCFLQLLVFCLVSVGFCGFFFGLAVLLLKKHNLCFLKRKKRRCSSARSPVVLHKNHNCAFQKRKGTIVLLDKANHNCAQRSGKRNYAFGFCFGLFFVFLFFLFPSFPFPHS